MRSPAALQEFCAGKQVYVWGAMIVGQGVCRTLERVGTPMAAFLDSSLELQGKSALGYEILPPASAFDEVRAGKAVIIAASGHCDLEIGESCKDAGLTYNQDYILSRDFNHIDPSVDVAGMCNLRCISCPRGNVDEQPPPGLMSAAFYQKVLDKLLREIPLLGSIQLYTWGEPLLNKELPEIITATREAKVLSALSSNLNYGKHLEAVVAAGLDWFKVSCSGWGESYEVTHTGGKWDVFYENLHKLAEYRKRLHPEMQVTVNYHLYKQNLGHDYQQMKALCRELSFVFRPSPAYLYPADTILDYVHGKPLSAAAQQTIPLLMLELDEGLQLARQRAGKPCPEERCFPINWDGMVRTCGVFFKPVLAENFLETPLEEILRRKRASSLCKECKALGIHQFTGIYLQEKQLQSPESAA